MGVAKYADLNNSEYPESEVLAKPQFPSASLLLSILELSDTNVYAPYRFFRPTICPGVGTALELPLALPELVWSPQNDETFFFWSDPNNALERMWHM